MRGGGGTRGHPDIESRVLLQGPPWVSAAEGGWGLMPLALSTLFPGWDGWGWTGMAVPSAQAWQNLTLPALWGTAVGGKSSSSGSVAGDFLPLPSTAEWAGPLQGL